MKIERHLASLAQSDPQNRKNALWRILSEEGLAPVIQQQEAGEKNAPVCNFLLNDPAGTLCPLFCAHYDAHPGSEGANDNAAALCILIDLAKELASRNIPADFAFLDGEENGHSGAKLFQAQRPGKNSVVVNLDMCGYGDTITVYSRGSEKKPGAKPFCDKKRLAAHSAQMVSYLPESDDVCFSTRHQPVLSIAIMPQWDTKYLVSLAAQGSGLLGRTPEFHMIISQMEVSTTMHGGFRDKLKWVQPQAMEQVYNYLLDACTAPAHPVKHWGLFG